MGTGKFIAGTQPTEVDRSHVRVPIDTRTGQTATGRPPQSVTAPQPFWLLPPASAAWAREHGLEGIAIAGAPISSTSGGGRADLAGSASASAQQAARPAGDGRQADKSQADDRQPLALLSPDPNRIYRIDPGLPADAQEVPVTALFRVDPMGEIVLLVDGAPYGHLAGPEFTAWWPLARGRHTFEAITRDTAGVEVSSGQAVALVA